jgi:hypothetical protein
MSRDTLANSRHQKYFILKYVEKIKALTIEHIHRLFIGSWCNQALTNQKISMVTDVIHRYIIVT